MEGFHYRDPSILDNFGKDVVGIMRTEKTCCPHGLVLQEVDPLACETTVLLPGSYANFPR